jgi:hypothetical protein
LVDYYNSFAQDIAHFQIGEFSVSDEFAWEVKAAKVVMDAKTEVKLRIQNKLNKPKIGCNFGSEFKANSLCRKSQFF